MYRDVRNETESLLANRLTRLSRGINKFKASWVNWLRDITVKHIAVSTVVILLSNAGSAWAEIYVHQQKDGTRKFTDQPSNEAQKIQLPVPIVVPSDDREMPASQVNQDQIATQKYQLLEIVKPLNDSIIRENTGNVQIKVAIEPDMIEQFNHQIVMYIDQHEVARGTARSINLSNMDRGTHEIQVAIEDTHGNTLLTSDKRSFHLQRYRVGQ